MISSMTPADARLFGDRIVTLTTQRENLRAALEDVEADPAFPKLCVRLRKRIADLLETT